MGGAATKQWAVGGSRKSYVGGTGANECKCDCDDLSAKNYKSQKPNLFSTTVFYEQIQRVNGSVVLSTGGRSPMFVSKAAAISAARSAKRSSKPLGDQHQSFQ
jgi:hypothetical protein